ncbi:glutathione S-transferase [Formivibrio citricus]|uniref:Glutathione S-transferase n=1 Tax=Formivibrio citricus TaxID=83765 RepID=A0A1I5D240_9NEIS|nr:glutathione S-transferase family protein [Formivibrio citricus]SFN93304.1 glutathione S-transferase [Formivibrio citricus]
MQLIIGNKNYSSWSLRPWLGLKVAGISFEETVLNLYEPEARSKRLAYSPTGKVPLLIDGEIKVWDSLAIAEYVAEKFPEKQLWPQDVAARALARSICAEMHSGFTSLRSELSMDVRASLKAEISPQAQADIDRIVSIWTECRNRFTVAGPFLFGQLTWADAFYAPIASRFATYDVALPSVAQAYIETVLALPEMQEWVAAAKSEPWTNNR